MLSRAEFVDRWKMHVAGLALYGVVSEREDGPMQRAAQVFSIPKRVEALLAAMYEDLMKQPEQNGRLPQPAKGQQR